MMMENPVKPLSGQICLCSSAGLYPKGLNKLIKSDIMVLDLGEPSYCVVNLNTRGDSNDG